MPMVVGHRLSSIGSTFSNVTLYHFFIGALQYLTIIRPDLTHSVNSLNQFLHGPINEPFQTVKHILLHVKGTLNFGLTFTISIVTTTTTYSDVEWTGCPNTCCFTLGYSIYLGYNIVYWSTEKQLFVSWSSYEFEYRTLATTAVKFFGCNIVSWSTCHYFSSTAFTLS